MLVRILNPLTRKVMTKTVQLTLNEEQFNLLKLCFTIGDMVKDSIEEKSHSETLEQIELHQLLDKAAYEAKLKGSGIHNGIYYHGRDIEEQMMAIIEHYDHYISSGEKDAEMDFIRKQLEEFEKLEKKKK